MFAKCDRMCLRVYAEQRSPDAGRWHFNFAGPRIAQPSMPHQKCSRTRSAHVASTDPRNNRPADSDSDDDPCAEASCNTYAHSQADRGDIFEPLFSLLGSLAQGCQPAQKFRRTSRPSPLEEHEKQTRQARVGTRRKTNTAFTAPAHFVPPCRVTEDGFKEWSF